MYNCAKSPKQHATLNYILAASNEKRQARMHHNSHAICILHITELSRNWRSITRPLVVSRVFVFATCAHSLMSAAFSHLLTHLQLELLNLQYQNKCLENEKQSVARRTFEYPCAGAGAVGCG